MRRDQHSAQLTRMLIQERRAAAGMTQRQLARAAGISLSALRDFEQGRTRSLRPGALEELAAVLDFDPGRHPGFLLSGAAGTRIEMLGPLTAWREGAQLTLGSPRQRAVLGLLALHWGTSLHRDVIVDTLWGQAPPPSAVTEVQGYVSRLRKLFGWERGNGRARHCIATVGTSYQLTAEASQLDAATFEQLVSRARHAHAGEDPARAFALYERALSLWRGEILANVDLLRQHPAVTALAARRSEAVLQYAAAAELAGAHGRVLPHLRDLCAREPFNEHAHAHLMIILAATGQQAAALRVFADMRHRLDDELGIGPSAVLAEAHIRVLRQQTDAFPVSSERCRPALRSGH
jgi:DNA-binding SARP family transcriptional activator/DNA-binding XRE family transcriptional regulator